MTDIGKNSREDFSAAANAAARHILFRSERCQYREFGIYADGRAFDEKYPALLAAIKEHSLDELMSPAFPLRRELASAVRKLPEYLGFLKTTCRNDFFFAAFSQTAPKKGQPGVKRTGPKDVEKFIIERLQNQHAKPRESYEFVVEAAGKVVGYVELFNQQRLDQGLQYERGIFITADQQAMGYGKEAIIALTDYAFRCLSAQQIFTMVDPENTRSLNNITRNSGAVKIGAQESKYAHLDGGGAARYLFHIYPENFYATVKDKGYEKFLMQEDTHNSGGGNNPPAAPGL
jgi:RimJ/RimL family protein N-acetyltransferase